MAKQTVLYIQLFKHIENVCRENRLCSVIVTQCQPFVTWITEVLPTGSVCQLFKYSCLERERLLPHY